MMKKYYYEFAIVVIISLLIIFATYIIERSIEKYALLKNTTSSGILVVQEKNLTVLKVPPEEIKEIKKEIEKLSSEISQIYDKLNKLYEYVEKLRPEHKTTIITNYYNYTYNYQIDEDKLSLILQYAQQVCGTELCKDIDNLILTIDKYIKYKSIEKETLYDAKEKLLTLKLLVISKPYSQKEFIARVLNGLLEDAKKLDDLNYNSYEELAAKIYDVVAKSCKEFDKVLTCVYIVYISGQKYNTNYDVYAAFDASKANESIYTKYLIYKYNITITPYYIFF